MIAINNRSLMASLSSLLSSQRDSTDDPWPDIVYERCHSTHMRCWTWLLRILAQKMKKRHRGWLMFQRRGQGVSLVLNHWRGHISPLNALSRLTNASTGHLRLAYYGTQFQGLAQFSGTDFRSPKKSLIASAGTVPVTLIPVLRVTIGDKMSHMIVASLS
mgnify:CR=1 FL=1